jgi:hypothetical protein
VAAIGLGGNEQRTLRILGKTRHESLDQREVVLSRSGVVVVQIFVALCIIALSRITESNAAWLLDENHVCALVPSVRVQCERQVLVVGCEGSLLCEEA